MQDKIKVIIATHKKYKMPKDSMYFPLHVGAEGKTGPDGKPLDLGYTKDNTGDNISEKNPYYCELTGLYWAWKNLDADYIGLAHYRRHFAKKTKSKNVFDHVAGSEEIKPIFEKCRVIVPKKRHYYIETLYSHYAHTHYSEQLDKTREIIGKLYPDYLKSYDKIVNQRSGYMFNMMIMEKKLVDEYCSWLFNILFTLEDEIDMQELSAFQARFYGRVSEIIFNVWLDGQLEKGKLKKSDIKELPCIHMEKINWWKKGTSFLKAKFFKKKYEGSF